jgi:hypothetical protein
MYHSLGDKQGQYTQIPRAVGLSVHTGQPKLGGGGQQPGFEGRSVQLRLIISSTSGRPSTVENAPVLPTTKVGHPGTNENDNESPYKHQRVDNVADSSCLYCPKSPEEYPLFRPREYIIVDVVSIQNTCEIKIVISDIFVGKLSSLMRKHTHSIFRLMNTSNETYFSTAMLATNFVGTMYGVIATDTFHGKKYTWLVLNPKIQIIKRAG